jgi:hypothetical protein
VASDLTQLSKATSDGQYQSLLASTNLQNDSTKFDSDTTALQNALNSAAGTTSSS